MLIFLTALFGTASVVQNRRSLEVVSKFLFKIRKKFFQILDFEVRVPSSVGEFLFSERSYRNCLDVRRRIPAVRS
jgi:hypothetical protein